jgi:hypothetical protein
MPSWARRGKTALTSFLPEPCAGVVLPKSAALPRPPAYEGGADCEESEQGAGTPGERGIHRRSPGPL